MLSVVVRFKNEGENHHRQKDPSCQDMCEAVDVWEENQGKRFNVPQYSLSERFQKFKKNLNL